jgi:hypothetical protein
MFHLFFEETASACSDPDGIMSLVFGSLFQMPTLSFEIDFDVMKDDLGITG